MKRIFFTSDTHFGHTNIIKYANRPFDSVEEMDEVLIDEWNKKVKEHDTVYHLGDFCFRNPEKYLDKLHGNIILILGNHDHSYKSKLKKYRKVMLIREILHTKIDKIPITMCHYPLRMWPKSHYNAISLYGHAHKALPVLGKSINVGVDLNNFNPLSFKKIMAIVEKLPDNPGYIDRKKETEEAIVEE